MFAAPLCAGREPSIRRRTPAAARDDWSSPSSRSRFARTARREMDGNEVEVYVKHRNVLCTRITKSKVHHQKQTRA